MTTTPKAPNILWICSDQQRYDTIGALSSPHVHTPNIDRLAAEGVAFTHAFCQTQICTPSRASFLTGMYPSSVHACVNGNERWAGAAPLISKLLADAGYDTGLVGKLHLAGAQGRVEPRGDDGYRVFEWSHHPENDWPTGHAYADWLHTKGYDPDLVAERPADLPPDLHQTMWCAERAIAFMEEERDSPWLMSVNPFDPHAPFNPPAPYLARYDPTKIPGPLFRESDLASQARLQGIDFQTNARRPADINVDRRRMRSGVGGENGRGANIWEIIAAYYAMIELLDDAVGRMIESLERTGQRENTIVIYMSDHGEALGDHGLLLKGCRFYEGLVRVPLIMSWPGHFQQGLVSDALVELVDIFPTLMEACGQPVHERVQGRSLLPILTGQADPAYHRDVVRCEYYKALNPNVPGRIGEFEGTYATMIRTRRHKLVVYHGHDIGELFDLERDPGEFDNLWDSPEHADIRFDLMKKSFDALAFAVDLGTPQIAYY